MKLRITGLILLLTLGISTVYGQKKKEFEWKIKKSEFKTQQDEGFKEAWRSVREGNFSFESGIGTYPQARDHYLFAHQYNSDNNVLNFRIGVCYLYTDDKYEALKYLRKAYDNNPEINPEINYYLGRAYHLVLEFDKAKEYYSKYKDYLAVSTLGLDTNDIVKLLTECDNGKKLVENPRRVIITNMGDSINSAFDDYFPIFANNDSTLYFTSRRPQLKKQERNPYDYKFYEDVFSSHFSDEGWLAAQPLTKKINSKNNDAAVGISPDDSSLFIYTGKYNKDVKESPFNPKKGTWDSPKKIAKKLRSKQSEGSLFFSPTGDTLYFISADEDLSLGGKDILMSVLNEKGKWTSPVSGGSLINSIYDEEGLFVTPDGSELYFSSRGHNSMGGFDVFHSIRMKDGTWSDPENMGYPLNTPDDDIFFTYDKDMKFAYYTTIREGSLGAKDIYKITFLGVEKELLLSNEDVLIAGILDLSKTGFFSMPEKVEIDSFYYLTGRVLDKKTNEPVFAKLEFIDIDNSEIVATAISADSGVYKVKFNEAKNYGVEVVAKDYIFFLDAVDLSSSSSDIPVIQDFLLEKVEVGVKVVLENIYFETSKATLKPESFEQLDQVVSFMENNETITLEISGHTDNTGSLKINTKLSNERAQSVVDYLVSKGIDATRLEAKGYAFSQPVAPNDTPEGREKNRRVEFKILSK
jgi:outer membrane protein OmpA-like peptidoglycan-associated protein/tetratricopeptide (TPR) repeat protein